MAASASLMLQRGLRTGRACPTCAKPGRRSAAWLAALTLFGLTACGTAPPADDRQAPLSGQALDSDAVPPDLRLERVLIAEGIERLEQQRYEDASKIFNAGLKFAPTSAALHFLNGLSYQLLYLRGNDEAKELGVVGFEQALRYEPAHLRAALQLGRLEFDASRYDKSAAAFRRAIQIAPDSATAHAGLAAAAYYQHDLDSASRAARSASRLAPDDVEAARALAMIDAAMGHRREALEALARHAALEDRPQARAHLNRRVTQWLEWHASAAQAASPEAAPDGQLSPLPDDEGAPPWQGQSEAAEANAEGHHSGRGQWVQPWYDCAIGADGDTGRHREIPQAADHEVQALPALPHPCRGDAAPRMVVLDVAFIRTEDHDTSSHGINLLDGLSYVLGHVRTVTDTVVSDAGAPSERSSVITTMRRSGTPDELIKYSLNIANASDNRSEVLARPSLVALDRMPSTFFSGRNITLGIAGHDGGASAIQDRPVGVGLSVTPTFVDAETLLLAVRTTRSFVQSLDAGVNFGNTLQTSLNSVSANVVLKMGQTLIVSGLSEQERQRASSGAPVLKDIPVLQYLFNNSETLDFTSSVLVLITPRPPISDAQAMEKVRPHLERRADEQARTFAPMVAKAMKDHPGGAPGNLSDTYRHSLGSPLFLQFRSGDLGYRRWSERDRLKHMLTDLTELIHY